MKKNLSFFLLIVFGLLILIYSKGCSNAATIPLKRNMKLEDSIRTYNYDTIKFARSSTRNSIPRVKLYLGFYGKNISLSIPAPPFQSLIRDGLKIIKT